MAKRITEEARVVRFFSEADLNTAQSVMSICRDVLKRREPQTRKRRVSSKAVVSSTQTGISVPSAAQSSVATQGD